MSLDGIDVGNGLPTKIGTFTVLEADKKILMMLRNKDPSDFLYGKFVPPGGKIEHDETPIRCAVREFREETGLDISKSIISRGRVYLITKIENFMENQLSLTF